MTVLSPSTYFTTLGNNRWTNTGGMCQIFMKGKVIVMVNSSTVISSAIFSSMYKNENIFYIIKNALTKATDETVKEKQKNTSYNPFYTLESV